MASKKESQTTLKNRYGINKNISQVLSADECDRLLLLLKAEPGLVKLAQTFASKNSSLGSNNATLGRQRESAKRKLTALESEAEMLRQSIAGLEQETQALKDRRGNLDQEKEQLIAEADALQAEIAALYKSKTEFQSQIKDLKTDNQELTSANHQLKKDNKDLKNLLDAIRLRLAKDTRKLLQYEDSEIRRALIQLFKWTLG